MSHEGNEKLNEILAGLLTDYQGLQALAEVQRSDFMKEITDETGRIDVIKLANRAKRVRDKLAAEQIGGDSAKPQVTCDPEVNHVKQLIENVTAAMEQVCEHSYDVGLSKVKEHLEQQLAALTAPRHNVKPVLELKHIAEIMRDWIAEESLAGHVKFDMGNMVKSLEAIIAKHIGEDVPVVVEGEATTESRLVHSLGVVLEASAEHTHPLDISQRDLRDVALWMNSVIANNPGFHNLGKEGYIVVPRSNNISSEVVESVKGFLVSYGQGEHSASELRSYAALIGSKAMANLPEWFATTWGHTSKGGFAALMYHVMTEIASQEKPAGVYISTCELGKIEEAIRNGKTHALVDFVKEHRK